MKINLRKLTGYKGSSFMVTVMVLAILLIYGVTYLVTTSFQSQLVNKLELSHISHNLAEAGLKLSQKFINVECKNPQSEVYKALTKNIADSSDTVTLDLTTKFSDVVDSLMEPLGPTYRTFLKRFELRVITNPNSLNGYNCPSGLDPNSFEKKGKVRIEVLVNFSGAIKKIAVTSDVRVSYNFPPVISRFTLFVENADSIDYNQVDLDVKGQQVGGKNPLKLTHGRTYPFSSFKTKNKPDLINEIKLSQGWVYLGNNEINLNLGSYNKASGLDGNLDGDLADGFHFYHPAGSNNSVIIKEFDQYCQGKGITQTEDYRTLSLGCFDISTHANEMVKKAFTNPVTGTLISTPCHKASALRLLGPGIQNISPTMIFGNIKSNYLQFAIVVKNPSRLVDPATASSGNIPYDDTYHKACLLPPVDSGSALSQLNAIIGGGGSPGLTIEFNSGGNTAKMLLDYFVSEHLTDRSSNAIDSAQYEKMMSQVKTRPYNRSLDYIATSGEFAEPEALYTENVVYSETNNTLGDFMGFTSPIPLDGFLSGKLEKWVEYFVQNKVAYRIDNPTSQQMIDFMKNKDFASDEPADPNKLFIDLSSTIYVNGSLEIDKEWNLIEGGIIVVKKDISIKESIVQSTAFPSVAERPLILISQEGKIFVESDMVCASLIALKGEIICNRDIKIKGNYIAPRWNFNGMNGGEISYNESMSVKIGNGDTNPYFLVNIGPNYKYVE